MRERGEGRRYGWSAGPEEVEVVEGWVIEPWWHCAVITLEECCSTDRVWAKDAEHVELL